MFDDIRATTIKGTKIGTASKAPWEQINVPELSIPKFEAAIYDITEPVESHHTAVYEPRPIDKPVRIQPTVVTAEAAAPIQIWEGTVQEISEGEHAMRVILQAKVGSIPDHSAELGLEYVAEQDRDLVKPGAVFYLTQYMSRTSGGTVRNVQELRFRRLPAWTSHDVATIEAMARRLLLPTS